MYSVCFSASQPNVVPGNIDSDKPSCFHPAGRIKAILCPSGRTCMAQENETVNNSVRLNTRPE